MTDRLRFVWPPILIGILVLAVWQAIVVLQDIKPYLLPAPSLIASNFLGDVDLMWSAAYYTATTAFLGLVLGTIVGVIMAFLAQRFIEFEVVAAQQAQIRRHHLAALQPHRITHHKGFGIAQRRLAITQHQRLHLEQLAEGMAAALRSRTSPYTAPHVRTAILTIKDKLHNSAPLCIPAAMLHKHSAHSVQNPWTLMQLEALPSQLGDNQSP